VTADPSNHTFLAETGERVVGFANGGKYRGKETDYAGELYCIYLLQAHQQQGIGRQLTLAIAEELHREGMTSMIVWVLRANRACEFYRKLGGKPAGSKEVVLGGATMEEVAYGWTDLGALVRGS
jgi:GNAT superfamily N-acetyltransferase